MATIKSYTDLAQSKVLAKILPIESADMCYIQDLLAYCKYGDYKPYIGNLIPAFGQDKIRCWSLAALLGVLPKYELNNFGNTIQLDVNLEALSTEGDETLLDLVVNMIIHLHELKML